MKWKGVNDMLFRPLGWQITPTMRIMTAVISTMLLKGLF